MIRDILKNKMALSGLLIITMLILVALLAPVLAPHDPYEQLLEKALMAPCWDYPFGTDEYGRCVLSRIIFGTQTALFIGLSVTVVSAFVGVGIGLTAGFYGGRFDEFLMRIVDVFLAFPGLILALVVAGLLGPGLPNVIFALALVGWMGYARVVRGAVLAEKEKEFVETARSLGASDGYIIFLHLLPNIISPVIVMASIGIGQAILGAAALSFLGIGVQPPTAMWGLMLSYGKDYLQSAPYLTIFPGVIIMVTVLAFNFLGDGLRDVCDPRYGKVIEE
ncbi:MAG: peptide/nickel transport system permease protein [Eubacteriaceae bacterium]|nr:peptide/nickel transport system permease protein [Eubacteriaceae bacterium]MDK2961087.1 peptide/nickel transport system permease protein [Eubacteriaceae bacterium]